MKTTFDTDQALFQILNGSTALNSAISGRVYNGDRKDNSDQEDVTINTITLSQSSLPQKGTSNVNIHVPDSYVRIDGIMQYKANLARLEELTVIVLDELRSATINGFGFVIMKQSRVREEEIQQHYVNLRIEWSIH